MRAIWKFELTNGESRVKMPEAAEIIVVQSRSGKVVLYADVDTDAPAVDRPFLSVGTGEEIKDEYVLDYIGTVQVASILKSEEMLVWHVFEIL